MNNMPLGTSGLLVSPICMGTMLFGSPVAEADAIRLTHAAIDQGINFIDTANAYEGYDRFLGSAGGTAELILGKALKDRRDKAVVATKVGSPLGPGPQDAGLTASHILRELDNSLRRLDTDYIDLYIIHWPDKWTPLEATLSAMETALRQGKVRYFGASNHWAPQLCELLWLADKHGWPKVVSSQIPYSLLRRAYHNDLTFCEKHNIAVTPYQALQGGLLTGKYRRGQDLPAQSRAQRAPIRPPSSRRRNPSGLHYYGFNGPGHSPARRRLSPIAHPICQLVGLPFCLPPFLARLLEIRRAKGQYALIKYLISCVAPDPTAAPRFGPHPPRQAARQESNLHARE